MHSIDEVLKWFKKNNISFVSSIPSSDLDYDYKNILKKSEGLFSNKSNMMIFNSFSSDGGLFVLLGKKNDLDKNKLL